MLALFAIACLGHLALLVASHNWWYGLPLPRGWSKYVHLAHAAVIVAFPLVLLAHWGWHLDGLFDLRGATPAHVAAAAYVALCLVVGGVVLPAITVVRLLRREPVAETMSRVLDVTRELGVRPTGSDKDRWLTWLPGNEVMQVELSERTLLLPRLPAELEGLTVLHLSDLHLKGTPDRSYFQFVADRCAEWQPDLVAITGDIVDSWRHQRWIVPVLGRLKWRVGAFAILGNHDYWYDPPYIRRRLGRLGIGVLGNGWTTVEVRGKPLLVAGHEGPFARPAPDLRECPPGLFRLLLSHTPDNVPWARRHDFDLVLAGHVHGGQVRLPVIGSILVPSRLGRRYDAGAYKVGGTVVHVSRGLAGQHPLRYFCRPEVTLLTLRRASGGA
jgi:predicted MPP superfamily phosphohydrolase